MKTSRPWMISAGVAASVWLASMASAQDPAKPAAPAEPAKPATTAAPTKGEAVLASVEVTSEVTKIDQKTREVTLKTQDGKRYTPPGGTIEVGMQAAAEMVNVWVRDTGSGIPPGDLPRIFERLYRVDKSRSRVSGGTGLGLAIAKHFVEAHGGSIWAESEVGKGTCIRFTIPRVDRAVRV